MKLAEIFKVNYSKGVKEDEIYDWSIQSAIVNIVEKDCVRYFCEYISTTDINSLQGLERIFYYKLRKNLKEFYLALDMKLKYSSYTKEQLLKNILKFKTTGVSPIEDMTDEDVLDYISKLSDEEAYKLIIKELCDALGYTRFQSKTTRIEMEIELMEANDNIPELDKQHLLSLLKELKGDK